MSKMRPVHPGEFLREEWMRPMKMGRKEFARYLDVPAKLLRRLFRENASVTPAIAQHLSEKLKWPAHMWVNIQQRYDAGMAARKRQH